MTTTKETSKEQAMKLINKIAAVAALTLAAFVAGPSAHAANANLNINATVTITVILQIDWYGAGAGADRTVHGNGTDSPTTLGAVQQADVTWLIDGDGGTGGQQTVAQGAGAIATDTGEQDAALQFVIQQNGNSRVDITTEADNTLPSAGAWATSADTSAGAMEFVMEMSVDDGANYYVITNALTSPGAVLDDVVAGGTKTTLDLRFTPPTTVTNAGVSQTIVVHFLAALG
jgi:hypothetical protein